MSGAAGEESFQRLMRGRLFHVEVNGVPCGQFTAKRTRDFSCSARGDSSLEIFSGKLTGEPALARLGENAPEPSWRGPGGEGQGWEELSDQPPGNYAVTVADPLEGGSLTFGIFLGS